MNIHSAIKPCQQNCYNSVEMVKAFNGADSPSLNEWTQINISQTLDGDNYKFAIALNGEEAFSVINQEPSILKDIIVYASNPWYENHNLRA